MNPKHYLGACALVAASVFSLSHAAAAVSLSLLDTFGDPSSVILSPGQSFTVRLEFTTSAESIRGLSYELETLGLGSGQFRITQRDIVSSPFDDLITTNAIALSPANALLDPQNDSDLGAVVTSNAVGAGTYLVANYTIQALPTIPSGLTYTIETANGIATDDNFNDLPLAPATYSVQVVPEPGAAGLLAIGLSTLAFYRRRES